MLTEYSTVFARMDARLEAAISGAWKVLGQVVAGESLLNLRAQLAALRVALSVRDAVGDGNAENNVALVKAEQGLAAHAGHQRNSIAKVAGVEVV